MVPFILIVEDDIVSATMLKKIFEHNEYVAEVAQNGKIGVEILKKKKNLPDLIISDIKMPIMDGYDFYMEVSKNPDWSKIPFFFLSGINIKHEDIRFGKMLGADDYFTKPFDIEDVLKSVKEKIDINQETLVSSEIVGNKLELLWKIKETNNNLTDKVQFLYIFYMNWNDESGPKLENYYPKLEIPSLNLKEVTTELYTTLVNIYDFKNYFKSNNFIFRITMDLIDVYVLIDKLDDSEEGYKDHGLGTHMIFAIAPNFHYLQAERFKETLRDIGNDVRKNKDWNIKEYWEQLLDIYQTKE